MGDPVVVESWHLPRALSDEALRLLTALPMDEIERRLRVPDLLTRAADLMGLERQAAAAPMAADEEVAELPPRPPLMEPPAHLALERYGITWDGSPDKPLLTRMADGYWTPWHVAADLLERQAASLPVARLPEDAQVIEPANRTILVPVPTPIPVSERPWERQGWCNKDGRCWFGWADEPDASWSFCKPSERDTATVSLPAHALPLPELE